MHERLRSLFSQHFGVQADVALALTGDGSARQYHRLVGPGHRTAIGAIGPDREENHAFLSYSRTLYGLGLPVPEVYGADEEMGVWLLQDLGDTTLFDALRTARRDEAPGSGAAFPAEMLSTYRRVVEWLPRFQVEGGRHVDFSVAYPRSAFDRQSILWDLNYFKYHFLKLAHVPFNEARLEHDFSELTGFLLETDTDHFLYRDFQSRNVMLVAGEPWFIDYQGGRRGALQYDIASLLYDAKADIPDTVRVELLGHYLDALESHTMVDRQQFMEQYRGYVLVRILQALGAYGYRGFFERKPRFLQSVPFAARNVSSLLESGLPLELPELDVTLRRIVERWGAQGPEGVREGLTVHVTSFSFRRGYPEDRGGHGGGHVFDCRGLPNPGREPQYANLSGLDEPVVEFIRLRPEFDAFLAGILGLTDDQVREYQRRGFSSLSVAFGCTGGQHRSVFLAERLAEHLRRQFPDIHVDLFHREESTW
ncbi:MAG: RNase adapter RapZ [Gemmatimonadota bacterium]